MEFKGKKGKLIHSTQSKPTFKNDVMVGCCQAQVFDETGKSLAIIEPMEDEMEATAYARLFKSAPELLKEHINDLEFLEKWLLVMEDHNHDEVSAKEIRDTIDHKKDLINNALTSNGLEIDV